MLGDLFGRRTLGGLLPLLTAFSVSCRQLGHRSENYQNLIDSPANSASRTRLLRSNRSFLLAWLASPGRAAGVVITRQDPMRAVTFALASFIAATPAAADYMVMEVGSFHVGG